jgi:hypothetical protein
LRPRLLLALRDRRLTDAIGSLRRSPGRAGGALDPAIQERTFAGTQSVTVRASPTASAMWSTVNAGCTMCFDERAAYVMVATPTVAWSTLGSARASK